MKNKRLIDPRRRRKIPSQFTWVDHRIVRDGYAKKCTIEALGLYLLLLAVSDSEGLSYYGDRRIAEELNCEREYVPEYRKTLILAELIVYKEGIYQLLELGIPSSFELPESNSDGVYKVGDIIKKMLGGMG